MRVAIVGAGVVGTAVGFALIEDGHEVELVDAGTIGAGASAGNAGWVTPSLATPLAAPGILRTGLRSALDPRGALVVRPGLDPGWIRWLWRFARASRPAAFRSGVSALLGLSSRTLDELDRMRDRGVAFEEHRAGLLAVARSGHGLDWFDALFDELRALGFTGSLDALGPAEATTLEPTLSPLVRRATHATLDRHVAPESLVAGLGAFLRAQGAVMHEQRAVLGLRSEGDRWALDTRTGPLGGFDAVVLATALGTQALTRPLGLRVPIVPAKGYSVTLARSPEVPAPARPLYLCEPKLGVTPLERGLRIAGFFELGARDVEPSEERAGQLVEETTPFLTALPTGAPLEGPRGWAGFRPATPDSLPLIGAVPGAPRVLLATGHGMLGVTLAPATGLAVALLLRGERHAWLAPFAPARLR